ncbi:translocation protein [Rhizopus microsporus var. microsporus]|uniref:Translocation protein SEC62 n=2 Tax=Rhizopus microsporus TaxID=58291 RepID=A0A2G4SIJ1_RHIZD|nr:translocation protein [Rhizopus microsporus ATCC 52813]ORE05661.1 translocation protein [Rhizopus microsporus var. microsporus]PHZ08569.1 translocation protein [Rhizopus microsporus ATCC 52813]
MSHQHGPGCNHGHEGGEGGQRTIHVNDANKAPPLYKNVANYLKDEKKSGLKPRQGVLNGKRFEYFKGKRAIDALLREEFKKIPPKEEIPQNREDAYRILNELGRLGFILRVDRGESMGGKGTPRLLQVNPVQQVQEEGYYMWIWEGSQVRQYFGAILLVIIVLAAVLFPLWPDFLKLGVWYLSVAVLGLIGVFFGIALIRLVLYIITLPVLPRGFWLFPNLFADCGVIESFIPLYGFDEPKEKKKKKSTSSSKSSASTSTTVTEEKTD